MTDSVATGVPFVDLRLQHQPLQSDILAAVAAILARGDFVLGGAVAQFEQAFAQAAGVAHGGGSLGHRCDRIGATRLWHRPRRRGVAASQYLCGDANWSIAGRSHPGSGGL
nr:hypothetical protein [Halomicronema hongdechloris]